MIDIILLEDFSRYYVAKIISFFNFLFSWGWFIYGIPIPIVPPTTKYNLIFSIKLYGMLFLTLVRFRKRYRLNKLMSYCSILLLAVSILSLEYDRQYLRDFQTKEELVKFLINDRTDKLVYTGDFNCEDFSRTLIKGARKKGYRFYYHVDFSINHALCKAYIKNLDEWVKVEPQNDMVF